MLNKLPKILLPLLIITLLVQCSNDDDCPNSSTNNQQQGTPFLTLKDKQLYQNGKATTLKGVSFGNEVWTNNPLPYTHHNELDLERVSDIGMNAIRFYLNYETLVDPSSPTGYSEDGWKWIDTNITWASKHGVGLILNMHVPPGGFQSNGNGGELWADVNNQKELIQIWKTIAARYKNEPTIAGYDLLNEPIPPTIDEWQSLAQQLVDTIRTVDTQHLIFVEGAISLQGNSNASIDERYFTVNDPYSNTMNTFHFYEPGSYTHQYASWIDDLKDKEGGPYPNLDKVEILGPTSWHTATFNSPALSPAANDWTYYESQPYTITDTIIKLGKIALGAKNVGSTTVLFDSIHIKEYDNNGQFVRNVVTKTTYESDGWYYWSKNNDGDISASTDGVDDNSSFAITGTSDDANNSNWGNRFEAKQGYSYVIAGYMKHDGTLGDDTNVQLRIDFEKADDPSNFSIEVFDKAFLEKRIQTYIDWAEANNTTFYVGEFGCISHCFENNRNGEQWVEDMIDIFDSNGLHWTYHAYHEDAFGLYHGYGTLVDPTKANHSLIDKLKELLK